MQAQESSDKTLIEGFLGGAETCFDQLYERYRRPLFGYLSKMLPGRASLVDDLFQQTWLKAIKSLDKYKDKQTFVSWLFRIAHNTAVDQFRKESRHSTEPMDDLEVEDEREIPWQRLDRKELDAAIDAAVDQLPKEQREVFLMRKNDVPFKDIADVQECSINTALARMRYAITTLRKTLKGIA